MPYEIFIKKSALKELQKLPESMHDRIAATVLRLKDDPLPSGAKKLRDRDWFRIRIGSYRVLYGVDFSTRRIDIYAVAHRKEAYR
ncbi:MAG: plasmid stabilization protein [Candidatus Aminicenantes bacterium RBG_16_63_16]|nr:MAG: plasmid stabilization protein [Candidatus Aminicenantes bacterium RBG_16_63_16]